MRCKAKRHKICGFSPSCGREDATLSCTYNHPRMVLAVFFVASFRTIFDSVRWNSIRIYQMCYVVFSEAMAQTRSGLVTFGNLTPRYLPGLEQVQFNIRRAFVLRKEPS
jgi:hypothetical protein